MTDDRAAPGPPPGLSTEEMAEIIAAMKEKRVPAPCEMCGVDGWVVANYLASPVLLKAAGEHMVPDYNLLQTSAVVFCSNCGNTKLFGVGSLGARIRR